MPLFEDIKKKVVNTTQGAVKATKELAETARLNSQIADEQRKVGNLYTQIGKLYFEQRGGDGDALFSDLCNEITAANEQIEKLQADIQLVKGVKICPNCKADVPVTSGFCGKCGTAVASPPDSQEEESPELKVKYCSNCGVQLGDGEAFCGSCGHKAE